MPKVIEEEMNKGRIFYSMKIRHINKYDDVNGFWGVAVSVWFQGCPHMCNQCFNPETWDRYDSSVVDRTLEDVSSEVLSEINKYYPKTLSILGGDPLAEYNRNDCLELLKAIKISQPNIKTALWTGYKWNEIKNLEVIKYIDIIVDGEFKIELKNEKLKHKGSSNQRVINAPLSIKENKVIEVNGLGGWYKNK